MINLIPVKCVEISEYDQIISNKKIPAKRNLYRLRPSILVLYNDYSKNFSNIHTLQPSNFFGIDKDHLDKCYSKKSPFVNDLIKRIVNAQIDDFKHKCPSCLYHNIQETDHYIPKEEYPEYSVLASNLIPICSICNKKKLKFWRSTNHASRLFIHFFKDLAPKKQFLFTTITFINGLPSFSWKINNKNGINVAEYSIISAHFEKLDLLNRYKEACNDLLVEIKNIVTSLKAINKIVNKQDIVDILISTSKNEINIYGPNYWKSIARVELANQVQYINSL